jgi:5-methylcytosine-specific restriction protein A
MPTINLNKKPAKEKVERNQTENRKLRAKAYNNSTWRKMRDTYLKEHAVCQDCISKGKITPASDIHHIKSPFKNGEINYSLLLDYTNLVSLCKECHGNRHATEQGHKTAQLIIEELDKLFEDVD